MVVPLGEVGESGDAVAQHRRVRCMLVRLRDVVLSVGQAVHQFQACLTQLHLRHLLGCAHAQQMTFEPVHRQALR